MEEICSIIQKINPRKAVGPSSIPCSILHHMKELAIPLCGIANISFSKGIHPDKLKITKIIPIFKKGSKLLPENYRPISLLPICGKILEKIIFNNIYTYLHTNNLITNNQSGFRPGDSTTNQLLYLLDEIHQAFDSTKSCEVRTVFLDISKAFDKSCSPFFLV